MKDYPAAYQATEGSALTVDKAFYKRIAEDTTAAAWSSPFTIPIRTAAPGRCRRAMCSASSPSRGRRSATSTSGTGTIRASGCGPRAPASSRPRTSRCSTACGRRCPTCGRSRPSRRTASKDYGIDEFGGRIHDLLGTRCDPYVNRMLTGEDFDFHCHSNLVRAVAPHGLTEFDVHDVLNVFQCTGLNRADKYFMRASPAKQGDHLEFFAEIDLLCALSTCPGGDLSVPLWGPDARDPLSVCRPLGIEIHALDDHLLKGWKPPGVAAYKGAHGMRLQTPAWET